MLQDAGVELSVHTSHVDEAKIKQAMRGEPPYTIAKALAVAKGAAVAKQFPNDVILSADQICSLGALMFDKPETFSNAFRQLQDMQGHVHEQHSAAALHVNGECVWCDAETVALHMRPLSDEEIDSYLMLDNPYDAAGSYYYESGGEALFSHVVGSKESILGLPLEITLKALREHKVIV